MFEKLTTQQVEDLIKSSNSIINNNNQDLRTKYMNNEIQLNSKNQYTYIEKLDEPIREVERYSTRDTGTRIIICNYYSRVLYCDREFDLIKFRLEDNHLAESETYILNEETGYWEFAPRNEEGLARVREKYATLCELDDEDESSELDYQEQTIEDDDLDWLRSILVNSD